MPIITHEDELELGKLENELVSEWKKLAKNQSSVVKEQKKFADKVSKLNIQREIVNRTLRDVLKQMQTLAREKRSNIKNEEVNIFQHLIDMNEKYIQANDKYYNAIKDLAVRKDYYIEKRLEVGDSLSEVADQRSDLVKGALKLEKLKNKMVEGEKVQLMEKELNDSQREFDRSRDVFLKKIEQFKQVRDEVNQLWIKLKNSITELS